MAKHKKKKTNLADNVRQSKKQVEVKVNPFEVKVNRQKHDVLGRKLTKFDKGRPGVSRSKAIKKRKDTLLQEYKQRDKNNKFVDKRFAENDAEMSVEDKMLKRFALERQKHHEKADVFKLNNEDEELTHYGQSLSQIEKFEAPLVESDEDEEDIGRLSAKHVSEEHFGGFFTKKEAEDAASTKTWKERMEEMIANTRKARFERQMEKEENLNLTNKLDAELKDIRSLMLVSKKTRNSSADNKADNKADDYDTAVTQLRFEARGQATDRLKTEEELAKEEKERLEKLEEDRLRRMKGITEREQIAKKRVHFSADDLSENFVLDGDKKKSFEVQYKDGKLVAASDEKKKRDDKSDSELEEDGDYDQSKAENADESTAVDQSDSEDAAESSQSGEEDSHSDLESESEEETGDDRMHSEGKDSRKKSVTFKSDLEEVTSIDLKERKDMMEKARKELPYTFDVPKSYDELVQLMEGHTEDNKITIIDRTRKCNHASLAEGNKEKLQSYCEMLLRYFGELALCDPPELSALDRLVVHLYELTQSFPMTSAKTLVTILQSIQEEFTEFAQAKSGRGLFPQIDTLLYLKLISLLFPTSDYRHLVVTPAMVMMSQSLTQCTVNSLQDVASGLFICTLFLEYLSFSKKFAPEVVNFLQGLLYLASTKEKSWQTAPALPRLKANGAGFDLLLVQSDKSEMAESDFSCPLSVRDTLMDTGRITDVDSFRLQAAHTCLKLVERFSSLYEELPSYREIFAPVCDMCKKLPLHKYPTRLKDLVSRVVECTSKQTGVVRPCLVKAKKRPLPLKLYEPSFDDSFDGKKKNTGDRELNEQRRLLHRHKKEMKGAIREIKRDNQFLARHQLAETLERDAERNRKVQEIHHMLSTQEGEFKAMKRKKGK